MNRDMLSRRLLHRGYEVSVARDGKEGIAIAQSILPNIILMDMSLPIIDGWEATSQLKKKKETQHIPILALTAHAMEGDLKKALSAGCDDFETKPIDFPRLLEKIEKLVNINKTT